MVWLMSLVNCVSRRRLLSLCTLLAAACGGGDLTLPSEGAPAALTLVSGEGQRGTAGSALADPLVVRVTDSKGRPVVGTPVAFSLVDGVGIALNPDTALTDADGRAASRLTLGPGVGSVQVNAQVAGATVAALTTRFTAMAVAGTARKIAAVSGDNQTAPVGSVLSVPLVVRVTDGAGNPVSGVTVAWTAAGGGTVSAATSTTDAGGHASVQRTLGRAAGTGTTRATAAGLTGSPVTFTSVAQPGGAATLQLVSGNDQSAETGTAVVQPLVVRVVDASGNGIPGQAVSWVIAGGGGTATPASTTTDASGRASTVWKLGPSAGPNTLSAVVSGVGVVGFRATATPGAAATPHTIARSGGDGQSAAAGSALPAPLSVKVTSVTGAAVGGVSVAWVAATGGGSVSSPTSVTDPSGVAQIFRTLGTAPGAATTTAAVAGLTGSPVTFTSTITAAASPQLALAIQPSPTAVSGAAFAQQPVVQLQSAAGAPLAQAGVTVTAAIASGGGTLAGVASRTSDASGRATFTDLAVSGAAGARTLIFAAGGFTAVTSSAIAVSVAPVPVAALIAARAGDGQTASAGTAVAVAPSVLVTDATGAPVPGVTVTFAAAAGAGTVSGSTAVTDAAGVATVGSWTLGTVAGPNTLTATADGGGISGNPITFSATAVAGAPDRLSFQSALPSSVPTRKGIKPAVEVLIEDAHGNLVSDAALTVAITLTGGTPGASLSGGDAQAATGGVGTFPTLRIDTPGFDYALVAVSPGLTSATSSRFSVSF